MNSAVYFIYAFNLFLPPNRFVVHTLPTPSHLPPSHLTARPHNSNNQNVPPPVSQSSTNTSLHLTNTHHSHPPPPPQPQNWARPHPLQPELLVRADSAAGRNLLTNRKARLLLGVMDVIKFEMVGPQVSVARSPTHEGRWWWCSWRCGFWDKDGANEIVRSGPGECGVSKVSWEWDEMRVLSAGMEDGAVAAS